MEIQNTDARERVLNMAETLFLEQGYAAVSMSDLAKALQMQKASLYHHAPNGKEGLYVEVMERILRRYRAGLEAAITTGEPFFLAKLQAAARWLLNTPSLHYERMMQSDMPQLNAENIEHLTRSTYLALLKPLETVFEPEMSQRGIDERKASYLAGAFLAVVESVHNLPDRYNTVEKIEMADFLIETLFKSFGLSLHD